MDEVWKAVGALGAVLHRDRIRAVADAFERLAGVEEFERTRAAFGPNVDAALVERLRASWAAAPWVTAAEISAAFKAAVEVASRSDADVGIELVWTGPSTGLIPTRRTEQVLLEVIESAARDLFLVSYVFYKAPSVVTALNDAVQRGVRVKLLLESSAQEGGAVREDSAGALSEAVPGAIIYVWEPAEREHNGDAPSASVHAKCAVADHKLAFITSANLTSAALERNMELGLLIRGGTVPDRLQSHLEALVVTRIITRWVG
jgi:cardiolipin synthase